MHRVIRGHDRELFKPLMYGFPGPQSVTTPRRLYARGQRAAGGQFVAQAADRNVQQSGDIGVGVIQLFFARMYCGHIEIPNGNFRSLIVLNGYHGAWYNSNRKPYFDQKEFLSAE